MSLEYIMRLVSRAFTSIMGRELTKSTLYDGSLSVGLFDKVSLALFLVSCLNLYYVMFFYRIWSRCNDVCKLSFCGIRLFSS